MRAVRQNPYKPTTAARAQSTVWQRGDVDTAFRRVTSPRHVDAATELTVLHRDLTEENSSWLVQFDHFASAWSTVRARVLTSSR